MNFWNKITSKFSKPKIKTEIKKNNFYMQIEEALKEFQHALSHTDKFIEPQSIETLRSKWYSLFLDADSKTKSFAYRFNLTSDSNKNLSKTFIDLYNTCLSQVTSHNEKISKSKIKEINDIINPIEGKFLDEQQLSCIAKEVKSHLVLAGAGTGKTSTIIGYIKYLLATTKCNADEILVLSFTNASATEMEQRIFKETNLKLDASTFHKLGLNIITAVEGKKPIISKIDLRRFIRNQLPIFLQSPSYLAKLCFYLMFSSNNQKSEFDFSTQEEYDEYLKSNPPVTLRGEKVKSYGEMDIANFLFQNGIDYIYEKPYFKDTRTKNNAQYYPDFYLPQYDVYIEYYGINRNGKVPSYFTEKDGKSASETYKDSIRWKRNLHKNNGTTLIEAYAYEKFEEILIDNLKQNLLNQNVILNPKSTLEIWNSLSQNSNQTLDRIAELFATIITLIKSNNCEIKDIRKRNQELKNLPSISKVLDLVSPLYDTYQNHLISNNEIDFHDMINVASKYISESKYVHNYKYVIVDEYQDISQSRFRLLYLMRQQKDYSLFCVGDDWQSIYKFNGSDIGFILDFDKYWGASETSKIETTYRFPQSLIDVSSTFIMVNPAQKKKTLCSAIPDTDFSVERITAIDEPSAVQLLAEQLRLLPQNCNVILLGRYRFDINILNLSNQFDYHYSQSNKRVIINYAYRKDLNISFMTIHASKGLQADYIFIINNKRHGASFPSQITDAPILQLLLDNSDSYPYAEERRLFYVATTRAKKKVWLITLKDNVSEFVNEITDVFGDKIKNTAFTCPKCGGKLIKRKSVNGEFYGCSNYSSKGCRYTKNLH